MERKKIKNSSKAQQNRNQYTKLFLDSVFRFVLLFRFDFFVLTVFLCLLFFLPHSSRKKKKNHHKFTTTSDFSHHLLIHKRWWGMSDVDESLWCERKEKKKAEMCFEKFTNGLKLDKKKIVSWSRFCRAFEHFFTFPLTKMIKLFFSSNRPGCWGGRGGCKSTTVLQFLKMWRGLGKILHGVPLRGLKTYYVIY